MTASDNDDGSGGVLRGIYLSVVFLTRLPAPAWPDAVRGRLAGAMWAFPVAGVIVATIAGVAYAICAELGCDPLVSAFVAVGAGIVATGGLHEDGLADLADGAWGAAEPGARLAIMSDSRIGAFGALALILSVGIRAAALAALGQPLYVLGALVAAAALSRAMIPATMAFLSPAKTSGLGASAGTPSTGTWTAGLGLALIIALFAAPDGIPSAIVGAAAAAALVAWFARRAFGGYTGDVLGAVQQFAEAAALALIAAAVTEAG
jgi:adenosylcobinamide-GDP ribazoletransferase